MKHAKAVRRIIFTVLIVAAVIVGFNTYTADYYHAKDYELQTTEESETDAYIAYGDPQSETGLIFYPGAKVEETAYAPVMDGLYGSEDGVLNMEKYQEAIGLAADCREYVLEGGNHAGFGNYGSQKGDGEAGITDREQWQETIDYIMDMIRQQQGEK